MGFNIVEGEFELPGIKRFMDGTIEHVSLEKAKLSQLMSLLNLQTEMVQNLSSMMVQFLDMLDILEPTIVAELQQQFAATKAMFNKGFADVCDVFIAAAEDIGLVVVNNDDTGDDDVPWDEGDSEYDLPIIDGGE